MARNKRDKEQRGKLEVSKALLDKLVKKYPKFEPYQDDWQYRKNENGMTYIPVRKFDVEELKDFQRMAQAEGPQYRGLTAQLTAHIDVILKPSSAVVSQLPLLETALIAFIKKDIIQGWVFERELDTKTTKPYLIVNVEYTPAKGSGQNRTPAHTTMRGTYWDKGEAHSRSWSWHAEDLRSGRNIQQLLLEKGLVKETKELVKLYMDDEEQFLKWRRMLGIQFLGNGEFEGTKWTDDDDEDAFDANMHNTRLIVDDPCEDIEHRVESALFTGNSDDEDEEDVSLEASDPTEYTKVPLWFHILCFNLDTHQRGWVHQEQMVLYKYRPELRDKLILSEEHSDLIDALTSDMNVLMDDIVTGKSGGTTVILQGKAGTGKTLTAEIYAEVAKVPLYRVHSGQLGTEAGGVEKHLKKALANAQRWKCALLIDEADVFLMARGTDLALNAVVGVFLRMLEYYDGLCFLTTNRIDAIDEAIISRCIAKIQFNEPVEEERYRLWLTLSEVYQFKLGLEKGKARELAKAFPKATGRDIKGLIRLTIKYARQRKKVITVADVKRMASFRGL